MRKDTQKEKQRLLADFHQYLTTRPSIEAVTARGREDIAHMNALDKLQLTYGLIDKGRPLDIDLPDEDDTYWTTLEVIGTRALTSAGRHHLRRMIDDEIMRRREAKAWWWKNVIIPAVTALTGLGGIVVGILAITLKK
jgi:hypothetical protein